MEINKDYSEIKNNCRKSHDDILATNKKNPVKNKKNIGKQKMSFDDSPKKKRRLSFSSITNNNNNITSNLYLTKKQMYNTKKFEQKKNQNKLIELIKNSEKSKTPLNNIKKNGKLLNLSINPVPYTIPLRNKTERLDRNGIVINKGNKKKVHITFMDKSKECKLIEEIKIESFKQYNTIIDMEKNEFLDPKNRCCYIF